MTRSLEDRVAVVVGAGAIREGMSNGRAAALSYARAGARVVCVDVALDRAEATALAIIGEGGSAVALGADATDEASMQGMVTLAVDEFGRIDVLHNNVGVGGTFGTPDQIPLDGWNREIAQNLTSAYLGIRSAFPVMREQGRGAITNISSTLATRFLRRPNVGYSAAKAGVEALTRACAAAYGPDNIRVNCIRIGFSETALMMLPLELRGLTDEQRNVEMTKSRSKVPLRNEHGDPFAIGDAAVFLASDAAAYVSGVVLNVDGALDCAPI